MPLTVALQHRLYRAAISIVPPTATSLRAIGGPRMESDEALLAAFASGDAGAFETLMQRHLGWMVAWACKHLPGPDAEDAAQEAFIALVRKAAGLHLDSTLRGYLFGRRRRLNSLDACTDDWQSSNRRACSTSAISDS